MTITVQTPGDEMYLIWCPDRKGLLTWDHDNKRYIMAFTTPDKAEEYNEKVLSYRSGIIKVIKRKDSIEFASRMVKAGVDWMVIDFPIENDKWEPQLELARDYGVVFLKRLVEK